GLPHARVGHRQAFISEPPLRMKRGFCRLYGLKKRFNIGHQSENFNLLNAGIRGGFRCYSPSLIC
ncbi:hypothetical protein ACFO0U_04635, partial [Chromohalobacter sarecensis]